MDAKRLLLSFAAAASLAAPGVQLKAGFARVDATPPFGVALVGHGNKRLANAVLDPLYISCIAFYDGKNKALMFTMDDLGLNNMVIDKIAKMLTAKTRIPRDNLYFHSTHTHCGPASWTHSTMLDEAENNKIKEHILETCKRYMAVSKKALADLRPATVETESTQCPGLSFCRRWHMKDGTSETNIDPRNPNAIGPADTPDDTVRVVRLRRADAPDIGIINFGTHPDTVTNTTVYSADWPGVVRKTFEAALEGEAVCFFMNAAQGDMNHFNPDPPRGWRIMREKRKHDTRIFMGRAIAGAALRVWDVCEPVEPGYIRGMYKIYTFPGKPPNPKEWMPLTTLAISDELVFAGFACEPYVALGRAVKSRSHAKHTVITCLTNGGYGYVGPAAEASRGGYESGMTTLGPAAGDMAIEFMLKQIDETLAKKP